MPWCRFFIPKVASPHIKADDPDLNDHIAYAKCIKGHVLRDANDWVLCENLPTPDAKCWQEGGDTLLSLKRKQREAQADAQPQADTNNTKTTRRQRQSVVPSKSGR